MKMQKFTVVKLWLFCILVSACNSTKSIQQDTNTAIPTTTMTQVERWVNGDFKFIRVDRLGNVYAVEKGNDLIRLDKEGKELFRYSNNRLAQLTNVDVSNPQKILLYYNSFQIAMMLDNTLSEIQKIDFNELGLWDIQAIGMSNDNQIWYFDLSDYRLKKITANGQELISSNSLSIEGYELLQLSQIQESNQKVYLNTTENGLLVFDNLGAFIQHIPEIQTSKLKPLNDNLVFLNEKGNIFVYNNIVDGAQALPIQNAANITIVDFDLLNKLIYYVDQFGIEKLNIK